MKLKEVIIHKYKSFETVQKFELENDITILVGMNESGKTSALEAIAKTNYFQNNEDFRFNTINDYPRKDKVRMDKCGENPKAITCVYEIENELLQSFEKIIGKGALKSPSFSVTTRYDNSKTVNISVDAKKFFEYKANELGILNEDLIEKLLKVKNLTNLEALQKEYTDEIEINGIQSFIPFFENIYNWEEPIKEFVYRVLIEPIMPKYLYYNEYYALPSRISIEKLQEKNLEETEYKTAKALFDLANINPEDIIASNNFEDFISFLEITETSISDELFKYWTTNKNLLVNFQIQPIEQIDEQNNISIVEHILDIRVKNKGVSLPLSNKSRGFIWFFSFLVWFKKIQEDKNSNYILLLDEPGLNLHATAQADLLRFLEDLSKDYQIIYTTHSPFLINTDKLHRVRTFLETDKGAIISDSFHEKDSNTIFPLKAALGFDIAKNLFVSKKNLLVEEVSDLVFLTVMSEILESDNRTGLRNDISIVPAGGLDKIAKFVSLLKGSELEIVCLLDSYLDSQEKKLAENVIDDKIIHKNKILFYDEFLDSFNKAELEDLFAKQDYLNLFNSAFKEFPDVRLSNLNQNKMQILDQINEYLKIDGFNHYRPAYELAKTGITKDDLSLETLDNFEKVFAKINNLFE